MATTKKKTTKKPAAASTLSPAQKAVITRRKNAAAQLAASIKTTYHPSKATKKLIAEQPKAKKVAAKKTAKKVYDALVLDKSGSMASVLAPTISGFNEYVEKIKDDAKKNKIESYVTLMQFNSSVENCYENSPVAKLEKLTAQTYKPEGCTALNDAIALAIDSLELTLGKKAASKDVDVTITVFTDGMENASKRFPGYKNVELAARIKEVKDKYGWTITLVGAGNQQEVQEIARGISIDASNTMSYNAGSAGTAKAFAKMSSCRSAKTALFASLGTKSSVGYFTGK